MVCTDANTCTSCKTKYEVAANDSCICISGLYYVNNVC